MSDFKTEPHWFNDLASSFDTLHENDAFRQRKFLNSAQGAEIDLDGNKVLNFSSNDYLGLANHPRVVNAFKVAVDDVGVGSGASHLVIGHHRLHGELEQALAKFTGRDRALLFSCGYMANIGILKTLASSKDTIFSDRLNHASIIDGALSSRAKIQRYRHVDIEHLDTLLKKSNQGRLLIATDSVFSMDGNIAPLQDIAKIAIQHDAVLMVDDAHGLGVLGETGAGCAEHFGLDQQELPILMGTLGKAMGVMGAFVAGSHDLIETLVQRARNYIYTTALPPAVAAATLEALKVASGEPERREHLSSLIAQFQAGLKTANIIQNPIEGLQSSTPIQPIFVGKNIDALKFSQYLLEKNILAVAIRPPTVPHGTSRLRISFSAVHSSEQVDYLLGVLEDGWKHFGLGR